MMVFRVVSNWWANRATGAPSASKQDIALLRLGQSGTAPELLPSALAHLMPLFMRSITK